MDLLERCTELQTLHLSGMPGLQWAAVYAPGVLTMPRRLTKLHARGVSLDAGFAAVLAKLPLLQVGAGEGSRCCEGQEGTGGLGAREGGWSRGIRWLRVGDRRAGSGGQEGWE